MNIKTSILAALVVAIVPAAVQAQETNGYKNYQVACESGANCSDFNVDYQQPERNSDIAQYGSRRTRRTRRTLNSQLKKTYVRGNLGVFLPGGSANTGFGGGGLLGYNISEKIAAELEIFDYFGGTDVDNLDYNYLGIVANGVYKYPFGTDPKSPYAFGGAGIGIGITNLSGDVADAVDALGGDTSGTGFLFQGKLGAGYPITDKIDAIGQVRYVNTSTDYAVGGISATDDAFSLDLGATYNF
ncbi:outer membrane beta-barrel protein [Pleurocapsa sp. FMAR1]|uniref:outer membrane beta-barrel protein n=1 Tax=Pleurocapsa sp. FMAR1 TaxID=3040204 RepID=UPI0029C92BD2|nr:outer membrane beta-barrel protein [Pleurocapsa sp. FMAR1]